MPVHQFTNSWDTSTDTGFTTWVNAIFNAMQAVGMVRSGDTGQAAAGVPLTRPGAGGFATARYVIYTMSDALQTSHPVFLKMMFGVASTNTPGVWVQVGTGTNGAGGLTGILHDTKQISPMALPVEGPGVASHGEGYVAFVGSMIQGQGPWFILERTRDNNGSPTGVGTMLVAGPVNANGSPHLGNPTVETTMRDSFKKVTMVPPVIVPYTVDGVVMSASASLIAGGVGPVFPWVMFGVGRAPWQSCAVISIPAGDYPAGVIETVICGNTAHFMPIPITPRQRGGVSLMPDQASGSGGNPNVAFAIRWEE